MRRGGSLQSSRVRGAMPDLPGIGFEGKSDLYAEMKSLAA
jgi:D(-)-tartrate dehydratase